MVDRLCEFKLAALFIGQDTRGAAFYQANLFFCRVLNRVEVPFKESREASKGRNGCHPVSMLHQRPYMLKDGPEGLV